MPQPGGELRPSWNQATGAGADGASGGIDSAGGSFLLRACYVDVLTPRNHLPIVSYP